VVDTDAEFPIEAAKSELRDALNLGDMDRLLSFYSDEVVDLSEGRFTRHGECAKAALRSYLERLFENFHVNLVPIVWHIRVIGEAAHDLGWHKLTLVSKHGGETLVHRHRYLEVWRKSENQWKVVAFMSNMEPLDE
jgi:ketosteroid isomerase-like protein